MPAMNNPPTPAYMLAPGQGIEGFDRDVKATRTSTGGALTLMESRTEGGAPMHVHSREDECCFVVEGRIVVECGGEKFEAGPRSFVFLPRGIPHAWDVISGVATVLIITVPGGFEEFMRDLHAAGSRAARDAVAAKHGIEWVRSGNPAV